MNLPRLVGMVHLPPLPGSPAWTGASHREVCAAARHDAEVLERAGFDAVMIQNSLDRPTRERVDQLTIAQLASVTTVVAQSVRIKIGINVVKNDGPAAAAIAAATGADFIRVKVLTGAVLSAEGIVEGCAAATHDVRRRSGHAAQVWADVYEPTSRPLLPDDFGRAVVDAVDFGGADAVIVTGDDALAGRKLAGQVRDRHQVPVVIGGRINAETVKDALGSADSIIIGSALKTDPGVQGRVDPRRAGEIVAAADGVLAHTV